MQVVKALTASETAYSASPSKPITESSPLAGNETTLVALVQVQAHMLPLTYKHNYHFAATGQNTAVASHEGMLLYYHPSMIIIITVVVVTCSAL